MTVDGRPRPTAVVALLDRDLVREELLHVLDHRDAQREDGQPSRAPISGV
jgi:hypothetical protein